MAGEIRQGRPGENKKARSLKKGKRQPRERVGGPRSLAIAWERESRGSQGAVGGPVKACQGLSREAKDLFLAGAYAQEGFLKRKL
jgi:hypothetical protein